jgi:hypothetical protein
MDLSWLLDCNTLCVEKIQATTLRSPELMIQTRHSSRSFALFLLLPSRPSLNKPIGPGPYKLRLNSTELRKTGYMSIGVRYDLSDRVVIQQLSNMRLPSTGIEALRAGRVPQAIRM